MVKSTIGAFEAKTHFSQVLEQVRQGATFVVTKRGRPVAEIRPLEETASRLTFGCAKGRVHLADDFDDPVPGMEEYTS